MISNIGTIYQSLQKMMSRLPNLEGMGVGISGKSIVFRFSWKPGINAEFQITPDYLEQSLNAQDLEDYLMEKMENYYKVWEVGEE